VPVEQGSIDAAKLLLRVGVKDSVHAILFGWGPGGADVLGPKPASAREDIARSMRFLEPQSRWQVSVHARQSATMWTRPVDKAQRSLPESSACESGFSDGAVLPRTVNDVRRALVPMVQPVAPSRATAGSDRQVSLGHAARSILLKLPSKVGCRLG
jgi:hypothetical protein